jgi:peptide/nickel transport system permease protein
MTKYIIKRLLLALLILFGVSLILYFLIRLMPVSYIENMFYTQASATGIDEAELVRFKALYGLEDDSFVGILKGYWNWLSGVFQGDLGLSFKYGIKVEQVISSRMGISFAISFVALILEMIIAIPLGIKCACNQYGKFDYVTTVLCMICMAFPSFFLGNLLIKWLAVDLGWFDPMGGLISSDLPQNASELTRLLNMLWHLILPMFVLVILDVGSLMRYTRTNTLEVLNADYIRTARAKGLSEGKVVYKHVFRNTMIPLVTTLTYTLPGLFGGAMITETVFGIPGIGQAAYEALSIGDIPLAMGYNMFIAILTVIGTLLADIMYAVVDPRVKLGK